MRVQFQELKLYAEKSGKCACGKRRKRTRKFWQTLNPFNMNESGEPKSSNEIYDELKAEALNWKAEPITCSGCEPKS